MYLSRYETGNGIKAEETGTLKKASSPDSNDAVIAQGLRHFFLSVSITFSNQKCVVTAKFFRLTKNHLRLFGTGSFSYTAPDGQVISLTYAADDVGGFQPQVKFTLAYFL